MLVTKLDYIFLSDIVDCQQNPNHNQSWQLRPPTAAGLH